MYPILWALEHAPVVDAEERAILAALVNKGDFDGCNCYRSYPKLAHVARVDPKTARRKCHAMEERGVIRRQPGPKPKGWLKLPKDKRPVVWEAMIPASFWSPAQLDEINQARAERDRSPITSERRPDLVDAPPKRSRADKGKERPDRQRKKQQNRGDSQSSQINDNGGTHSPDAGGLTVPSRGDSQSPNPPIAPSDSPSSPPAPPTSESPASHSDDDTGREEDHESTNTEEPAATPSASGMECAENLVDDAVRRWGTGHRAPGVRDRHRLAERVAAELDAGGDETVITDELTRDLADARSAVSVVLGARTATPGWGRTADPRPDASRYEPTGPRPAWCGVCDERTRLVAALAPDGSERMRRCQCHPDGQPPIDDDTALPVPAPTDNEEQAPAAEIDEATLERMRASLTGDQRVADGDDGSGLTPAARAAADGVRQLLAQQQ